MKYTWIEIKNADKEKDGFFALNFYRKISKILAYLFVNVFHFTNPNYITVTGLIIGLSFVVLALSYFSPVTKVLNLGILYFVYFSIDCCDGIVARVTGNTSEFGKKFDAFVDGRVEDLMFLALFFAFQIYLLLLIWVIRKLDKLLIEKLNTSFYKIIGDKIFKRIDNRTDFHIHTPDLENIILLVAAGVSYLFNKPVIFLETLIGYTILSFIGNLCLFVKVKK